MSAEDAAEETKVPRYARDDKLALAYEPPPTKWTISRRSPSLRAVCGQRSRGTMSRLSSTATRSDFILRDVINDVSVNPVGDVGSGKERSSPLM